MVLFGNGIGKLWTRLRCGFMKISCVFIRFYNSFFRLSSQFVLERTWSFAFEIVRCLPCFRLHLTSLLQNMLGDHKAYTKLPLLVYLGIPVAIMHVSFLSTIIHCLGQYSFSYQFNVIVGKSVHWLCNRFNYSIYKKVTWKGTCNFFPLHTTANTEYSCIPDNFLSDTKYQISARITKREALLWCKLFCFSCRKECTVWLKVETIWSWSTCSISSEVSFVIPMHFGKITQRK